MENRDMDNRRRFSDEERRALFIVSGGICETPGCGNPLDKSFHADHVVPYSKGGETSLANGQALCKDCNLQKGAKGVVPIVLRDWQKECLSSLQRKAYSQGLADFLVNVTPGGGKTIFALSVASEGIRNGSYNFVIVVVPSDNLVDQWAAEAWETLGIVLDNKLTNKLLRGNKTYDVGFPEHINGYVTTYHSVSSDAVVHNAVCQRKDVLVIMDEIHHAGEDNTWGEKIQEAFKNAKFRLMLSGTPFRSGGAAIPFVRYDSDGVCSPDYSYGYAEGLSDDICRPVIFPQFDGKMEWLSGEESWVATFNDDLDKKGQSQRLATALKADGNFMRNMVGRAHEKLTDIRTHGDHPDAAGLIVCMDKRHANEIAKMIRRDYRVDPVVVQYDDINAQNNIKKFKTSAEPWIIAINMVSEGVDIKRVRVIVYATNVITDLFFRQVMGRAVRVIDGIDEQTAYMYIPKDKRLVEMARSVQREVRHALLPIEPKKKREPGEVEVDYPPSDFIAIDSEGDEDGHIYGQDVFMSAEIDFIRQMQARDPALKRTPEAPLCAILREYKKTLPLAGATDTTTAVALPLGNGWKNPLAEADKLRKKQAKIARQITQVLYPNATEADYGRIHGEANKAAGITTKLDFATLDQLRDKVSFLEKWWGDVSSA